jgi:hypothetical protein
MAGLLDQKTRILDTLITNQGRSQAASGKMKIEYVSFSDAGAIYALDTLVSGGLDFTSRITFEAGNLPQDQIVYEVDDSGKLLGNFISGETNYTVTAGQIYLSGSDGINNTIATGSQFSSLSDILTRASLDNFKRLSILSSPDPIFENYNEFNVYPQSVSYDLTPTKPIPKNSIQNINIDKVESLFYDKRLSHIPNFKFLPPINKPLPGRVNATPIGDYTNVNQKPILQYSDLAVELDELEKNGYKKDVQFIETSRDNNLLCQFFEMYDNQVVKLDVIDFGTFPADENGKVKHVFFVGKVFTDGYNVSTYVNLFVLVFEQ